MNPLNVAFAKILGVFLALALTAVLTVVLWGRYGVGTGLAFGVISLGALQIGMAFLFSGGGLDIDSESEELFEVEDPPDDGNVLLKKDGTLNMVSTEYYKTYIDEDNLS